MGHLAAVCLLLDYLRNGTDLVLWRPPTCHAQEDFTGHEGLQADGQLGGLRGIGFIRHDL